MLNGTITENLVVDDPHKEAFREAQRREESATKDMAIAKSLRARVASLNYEWGLAASLAEEAAKLDPKYSEQAFKYREEYNRIFKTDKTDKLNPLRYLCQKILRY